MKKKLFFVAISFILFVNLSSNSFAGFDLKKELNKVSSGGSGANPVKNLTGNVEDKIDQKLNELKKEVIGKVEGEIKQYKEKIDAQTNKITKIIDEVEEDVNKLRDIKSKAQTYLSKAQTYIKWAKIAIGVLSSGILVLLFVVWRIWRNIIGMKKVFKNITNYDDIKKRIDDLEKQVATIKKS